MNNLFKSQSITNALLLTGEIAYTPKLRVVPGTTIVGDAATASIISNQSKHHKLLAIKTKFIPGFSKGIYLSEQELGVFNAIFIPEITTLILTVLNEARLKISEVALILPHNVSVATWKKICVALKIVSDKVYLNCIPQFSHCFCSDHIINLHYALLDGRLKKGDLYMMVACGMGFFMGAAVFQY